MFTLSSSPPSLLSDRGGPGNNRPCLGVMTQPDSRSSIPGPCPAGPVFPLRKGFPARSGESRCSRVGCPSRIPRRYWTVPRQRPAGPAGRDRIVRPLERALSPRTRALPGPWPSATPPDRDSCGSPFHLHVCPSSPVSLPCLFARCLVPGARCLAVSTSSAHPVRQVMGEGQLEAVLRRELNVVYVHLPAADLQTADELPHAGEVFALHRQRVEL